METAGCLIYRWCPSIACMAANAASTRIWPIVESSTAFLSGCPPRGKGTFSARYGRASFEVRAEKSNYTIARRPFAEGNSLRGTGQNVEGALDQVGPYV